MATLTKTRSPKLAPKLAIRRARWDDMRQVVGFLRSTADWYRPFLDEKDMAEHEVDMDWAAKNFERREFFVAETPEGAPVGTVSLQYFGDWAYLGYVYLDEKHTGRGYGGRLLAHALGEARSRSMQGLALISHPKATWAVKCYLKAGFRLAGESRAEVLSWNGGVLQEYYEEGFQLYLLPLGDDQGRSA